MGSVLGHGRHPVTEPVVKCEGIGFWVELRTGMVGVSTRIRLELHI